MTDTRTPRPARRAAGFSLIELILVIVILGVLMSVVTINVLGQGKRAKIGATEASLDTIRMSLNNYHLEYSEYPPTLVTLQTTQYLSEEKALKDGWGRAFFYRVPGSNSRPYDLSSVGEDPNDLSDDIDVWTMNQ